MPAHGRLDHEQRYRPDQQEDDPWDQELAAAVLSSYAREPPDVPGANGHTDRRDKQSPT